MKRPTGSETPDAPGWYPDPQTGRLRRFDGRVWTGETRDLPPWMGGAGVTGPDAPGADPEGKRRIGRRWIVVGAVVGVLFLVVSAKAWNSGPDLPPRTVFDNDFVAAANAACRESLPPLKDERPKPGTPEGRDPGPNERVAAQVDETADALAVIAEDLRKIPVRPEDQPKIDAWLGDWAAYADLGHRYADAVRDDSRRQEGLIRQGSELQRRADDFARANGLRNCTLA